jgi:apolipoprotein N-acyltransferase
MTENNADPVRPPRNVSRRRGQILSALAGLGIAFGQVPYGAYWLAFPALGLLVYLGLISDSARQAAWRAWLAGFFFALVAFFWIVEPFMVDVKADGWMAPFALFFMASGLALFWALAFWLARRIAPARSGALALALPVLWTASELLRSYVFTGFPWGLTSYIWIDSPVYQLAAFVGPHGLTLATMLLVSGAVFASLLRKPVWLVAVAVVLGAAFGVGTYLQNKPVTQPDGRRPVVRLIQPNAPQDQKWDPEMMPVFYQRQLALTREKTPVAPDLVIWPEAAVGFLLSDANAPLWEISQAAGGATVVLGALRLDGLRAYNSLAVLGDGGKIRQIYDKYHLVPFGEYVPGGWVLNRLGLKAMTAKYGFGFSAGPGPRVLDLGPLGKVQPLICYEAIFPHEIRSVDTRPDWMMMLTNDAWFGANAGPRQHFAQARARAIEMALPMVRVANTGISAVIDARGRVLKSLPLGVSGRIDAELPAPLPASPYWRFGDTPVFLLLIVLGLAAFAGRRRKTI